jgi:outer membrane protein assembly factor BamB
MNDTDRSRRDILRAGTVAATGVLAGCSGVLDEASTRSESAVASGWPMFGFDPARSGHAPDLTAPTGGVTDRWTYEIGEKVRSSPAVADGTVYVGSKDMNVYALSAVDGTEQWRFETRGSVRSSPAVVGDTVYIGSDDGKLYAVSAADGTERWHYETDSRVYASFAAVENTVYAASYFDGTVYALTEP